MRKIPRIFICGEHSQGNRKAGHDTLITIDDLQANGRLISQTYGDAPHSPVITSVRLVVGEGAGAEPQKSVIETYSRDTEGPASTVARMNAIQH